MDFNIEWTPRALSEDEIGFVVESVMGWIDHSPQYSPCSYTSSGNNV